MLQWGRGQMPPEIHVLFGGPHGDAAASMGPGADAPGNVFWALVGATTHGLQWGRGQMPPEIRGFRREMHRITRFNGAGGRCPRKLYVVGQTEPAAPASMGPGADAPGNYHGQYGVIWLTKASMGPGADAPGNKEYFLNLPQYRIASMGPGADAPGNPNP